jgi:hypothetical protein
MRSQSRHSVRTLVFNGFRRSRGTSGSRGGREWARVLRRFQPRRTWLQAEGREESGQAVDVLLSLADDGVDGPTSSVDQRASFHDPGIDVIDVEPGPDSRLDQRHLLGADGRLAPKVVEEVLSPV